MGYTHYWTLEYQSLREIEDWVTFYAGANEIIKTAIDGGLELDLNPKVEGVFLNGVGDDAHETLAVSREYPGWNCCKTAEKPYDTVVTAILIWLKKVFGDLVLVKSDGTWDDWQSGAVLYETAGLGTPENPLSERGN